MSLFSKPVKGPAPVNAQAIDQSQGAADAERRARAAHGGRNATFLWDAPPIQPSAPKPSLFGGS